MKASKNFRQLLRESWKRGYKQAINEANRNGFDKFQQGEWMSDDKCLQGFVWNALNDVLTDIMQGVQEEISKYESNPFISDKEIAEKKHMLIAYYMEEKILPARAMKMKSAILSDFSKKVGGGSAFYRIIQAFFEGGYWSWNDASLVIHDPLDDLKGICNDIKENVGEGEKLTPDMIEDDKYYLDLFLAAVATCVNYSVEGVWANSKGIKQFFGKDRFFWFTSFLHDMWQALIPSRGHYRHH